jgi:hypothetical protein
MDRKALENLAKEAGLSSISGLSETTTLRIIGDHVTYLKRRLETLKRHVNIHWSDVFDSQRSFPLGYKECQRFAKEGGYKYIAFNGRVLRVEQWVEEPETCHIEDLSGDRYKFR